MIIPEIFDILGITYKVKLNAKLFDEYETISRAGPRFNLIELQDPNVDYVKVNKSRLEKRFLDELVFVIIYSMGENELKDDETLISSLGGLLHQAIITSKPCFYKNEIMIPKELFLMGQKIKILIKKDFSSDQGLSGKAMYPENIIALQGAIEVTERSKDDTLHSFLHELIHFCLNFSGHYEVCGNEKFVDLFSGLLHQTIKTMKGDVWTQKTT